MVSSKRATVIVAIVAVSAIVLGMLAAAIGVIPPTSGVVVRGDGGGYLPEGVGVIAIPGARSALLDGDVVTSIAGVRLDGLIPHTTAAAALALETGEVSASIIRDGEELAVVTELVPYPLMHGLVTNAGTLVFVMLLATLAVFVFWKRPRDVAAAGLLLMGVGAAASTPAFLLGIDPLAFVRGTAMVSLFTITIVYFLLYAGLLHFTMAFPRPFPVIAERPGLLLLPYVAIYGALLAAVPLSIVLAPQGLGATGLVMLSGSLITLVAMVAAFALMAAQWRRSTGEDRRMLRGVVIASGFVVGASLALWAVPEIVIGRPLLPWSFVAIVGLPFIVALAAAVLRHRAFDIDVVINRSLVYGGLTILVLATYLVSVTVLGMLFRGSADLAVALLGTSVAALVALPLRDVLQRTVDRALYGDRDEPVRAIRRLGDRLTWTVDSDAVPEVIVNTVAASLRLPYVALELGGSAESYLAAERGHRRHDMDELVEIPLVARSVVVGRLLLSTRAPGEALSTADRRLLDDLARQAGPAVDTLVLHDALQRSRERIVLVVEEERRRLRRDLHDGLGPTLAAIGMRAEAASRLVESDPDAAKVVLAEVHVEVQAAVADVRRVVDGLRPPALDELGLVGAIEQQAHRLGVAIPEFVVESPRPIGDLPAAVEVAAYRIAVEAMTNVVRHSGAHHCRVHIAADGSGTAQRLTLEVEDDGAGLAPVPEAGVGLASMRERAAMVGGDVQVEGRGRGGTIVRAWLPMGTA